MRSGETSSSFLCGPHRPPHGPFRPLTNSHANTCLAMTPESKGAKPCIATYKKCTRFPAQRERQRETGSNGLNSRADKKIFLEFMVEQIVRSVRHRFSQGPNQQSAATTATQPDQIQHIFSHTHTHTLTHTHTHTHTQPDGLRKMSPCERRRRRPSHRNSDSVLSEHDTAYVFQMKILALSRTHKHFIQSHFSVGLGPK